MSQKDNVIIANRIKTVDVLWFNYDNLINQYSKESVLMQMDRL